MKQFVLYTKSDSGDEYVYFITHDEKPTTDDIIRFLWEHAHDKDEDFLYENSFKIDEILNSSFRTIPKLEIPKKKNSH